MMRMKLGIRWFICAVACLLIAGSAFADDSYAIFGTVTTNTGAPLEGVRVDFGEKLAAVVTDDAGYYEAEGAVEGGVYLLEPAAAGWTFAPARRAVVMGSGDEQVNFVAEPVGGPLAGLLFAPPTAASAQTKIIDPWPTVLYPVGGETWKQGNAYNIRWTHTAKSSTHPMNIRLLKSGVPYCDIANGTPNDGSFWWKVPASVEPGSDYRAMVDDGFYGATSEANFTIQAAPLVTYPNDAGVCWRRGQAYQITWQGFPGANVKIQLYRGSLLSRGIAWSTPNDGSFWWSVPGDQRTADNYRIKITEQDKALVSDMSDKPFTIVNNPRVTYPTYSGVVWDIGGSYNITWRQFVADQVKIDLLRCGTFDRTITAATANDGSFSWQVPYDLSPSGGGPVFKIRVRAVGCAAQSDKSNEFFDIQRVPAVIYPSGNGITWNLGTPYMIYWYGFTTANVKIELLKGWALSRVVSNWTPNDGSFKWWVPAGLEAGTNYRIRVTGRPSCGEQDVSDNNFRIKSVPLVRYPTASGIEWDYGDGVQIKWQGFDGALVRIELRRWGAPNKVISSGTSNDGSFWWSVSPGSGASGNGFKVRITDLPGLSPPVYDESNQFFRINCTPIVVSPNGGSTLSGSSYDIQWCGFSGPWVRIELWYGAAVDHVIVGPADNNGSWDWDLSGVPDGTQYRIRISSLSEPSEFDFSDSEFTVDN